MNKAVLLFLATTAIVSIVCLHLVRELREEKARGDALQTRILELEKTVAPTSARSTPFSSIVSEPSPGDAQAQEAEEQVAPPPAPERQAAVGAMPLDRAEEIRRHLARQRDLLQDPEYREAMRAQHRLSLESSYPNLASQLGLSEQEADQLLDLLAEHQVRGMEHHDPLFLSGERPDEATLREAQHRAEQRHRQQQTEIETLLGLSKYQKWQEYQQTLSQRHRVASIQSSLAMAGTPLNAEQSSALLSALVEEQRAQQMNAVAQGAFPIGALTAADGTVQSSFMGSSRLAAFEEHLKTRERSQERLLATLQSRLTAQQLAHLQEMFERELEMQRAHMKMQRAQGDTQSNIGFWSPAAVIDVSPRGAVVSTTSEEAARD